MKSEKEQQMNQYGTRMTRIAQIFTDPRVSASSAQSVFHQNPATIDEDKKPQMKMLL